MAKISNQHLAEFTVEQLERGVSFSEVSNKLASYLVDARQTRELPAVMRAIDAEMARRGSDQVIITSAHEVSSEVKLKIAEILGAKNPVFSEVIDPLVIGGVKARSGEREIDLTVHGKIQKFKAGMLRSN